MKSYFPQIKALVFDIDDTLFRHEGYYTHLRSMLVKRYAKEMNQPYNETATQIENLRKSLGKNGGKASYTFTFKHLGISVSRQSQWKNELYKPEDYLSRDDRLIETCAQLAKTNKIFAFTNNSTFIGSKTLEVLGIREFFTEIWSSESIGEPKPSTKPYRLLSRKYNIPIHGIVAIGDRYNVDLEAPIGIGCAGILVESMEDVYLLSKILSQY